MINKTLGNAFLSLALTTLTATAMAAAPVPANAKATPSTKAANGRLVTIGGSISEIVCALGACERIVGSDESSLYPASLATKPRVGYYRGVAAEGVLSLKPTLVLATDQMAPAAAIEQIKASGTPLEIIVGDKTIAGAKQRITRLATILGADAAGAESIAAIDASIARVQARLNGVTAKPKVLFVYARGAKHLQVGGRGNAASELIDLAGGVSAVTDFDGYKPMTAEAVAAANPDVILMTSTGADSVGAEAGILAMPGVALTKAGRDKRVVLMDDVLLLGFGARIGQAVEELHGKLHPSAQKSH